MYQERAIWGYGVGVVYLYDTAGSIPATPTKSNYNTEESIASECYQLLFF